MNGTEWDRAENLETPHQDNAVSRIIHEKHDDPDLKLLLYHRCIHRLSQPLPAFPLSTIVRLCSRSTSISPGAQTDSSSSSTRKPAISESFFVNDPSQGGGGFNHHHFILLFPRGGLGELWSDSLMLRMTTEWIAPFGFALNRYRQGPATKLMMILMAK
jgi:hypothetical protein